MKKERSEIQSSDDAPLEGYVVKPLRMTMQNDTMTQKQIRTMIAEAQAARRRKYGRTLNSAARRHHEQE